MKKQQYILLSAILLLLGACSQKEEAVYGKGTSYVQRTNQTLSEYASTLEKISPMGDTISLFLSIKAR